jgi:serine/threonine protein phosphatase PrpC
MEVQFWATTDPGRVRDDNEDNYLVDSDLNLFVVCDGMGGHAGGEVASAISVQAIHEVVTEQRDLIDNLEREPSKPEHREAILTLLERAITEASDRVYSAGQRDSERNGMGTTCSALLVLGGRGFIGHVGDSRIYRIRQDQVEQMTDDHSLLNEMIRQGRAKAGDSIPNQNAVTRAVGVREVVDVDTSEIELAVGDLFVLCSDGLSGYLDDDEQLLSLVDGDDLERCTNACIQHALKGGGKDNITTILVGIASAGASQQTRLDSRTAETLASVPYFAHATPSELAQLASVADRHGFDAGSTIIEQDMSADALCVIVKGSVGVTSSDASVTVLEPGESFGAVSLFAGAVAGETYEALEPTKLIVFRRAPFFEMLRRAPELSSKVLSGLAARFAGQLRRVPAELRFEPQRWDTVRIQTDDHTPAPGALVVNDRPPKKGKKLGNESSHTRDPFGGDTSPTNATEAMSKPDIEKMPEGDPDDLRSTMQLDLNDDSVEEI